MLVQWKQLDSIIIDTPVYTGSLSISGSIILNDINLDEIIEYSIFRPTGSFFNTTNNIGITGSLQLSLDGVEDYFSIAVAGEETLKVTEQGVLQLKEKTIVPDPIPGGIYYGEDDTYYFGYKI